MFEYMSMAIIFSEKGEFSKEYNAKIAENCEF